MPETLLNEELLFRALCGLQRSLDRLRLEGFGTDPRVFPPALAEMYDRPADRRIVAVAAGGSFLVTLPAIPQSAVGIVRRVGVTTSDPANTVINGEVNGVPVAPLVAVQGAIGSLENPTEIPPIDLRANDTFVLRVTNNAAGATSIAARVIGWAWYPGGTP
jgi:hypothetical protein